MPKIDLVYAVSGTSNVNPGARDLVYAVAGKSTATAGAHDVILEINGSARQAATFTVTLGPDIGGLEPYTTQTLTATVTGSPTATVTVEQVLGPLVLISGTGPWTYVTPAEADLDGAQLRFLATATDSTGQVSAEVDHFIYPNTVGYYNELGQLVAAQVWVPDSSTLL